MPTLPPHLPPYDEIQVNDGGWLSRFTRHFVKILLDLSLALLAWAFCERIFVSREAWPLHGFLKWALIAMGVNHAFRLTSQHFRLFGFHDGFRVSWAVLSMLAVSLLVSQLVGGANTHAFNLELAIGAAMATGALWLMVRAVIRVQYESWDHRTSARSTDSQRTIIIGAGRLGALVCEEMRRNPARIIHLVPNTSGSNAILMPGIQ